MVWDQVADATGYYVAFAKTAGSSQTAVDGDFTDVAECMKVTEPVCLYSGPAFKDITVELGYNGSRYYKVKATNAVGDGPLGEATIMWKAKAPEKPTGVERKPSAGGIDYFATDKLVTITWTAPNSLNGIAGKLTENVKFGITTYNVFYGFASGRATTSVESAYTGVRDTTTQVFLPEYGHNVTDL